MQRVRDEVGAIASLQRVDIVAALPKTRSGKILRKTMREIADGRTPIVPGHDRGRLGPRDARAGAAAARLACRGVQGVFTGFATIAVVIGVGALLAHLRIVDLGAQQVLSRIAFFVASPALMVITLSGPTSTRCSRPTSWRPPPGWSSPAGSTSRWPAWLWHRTPR